MYSRPIRILHALVALGVLYQLIVSLLMRAPQRDHPVSQSALFLFSSHKWVGLFVVIVLFVSWAYRLIYWKRENQGRLFPWLSGSGINSLKAEGLNFLRFRWKQIPEDGVLAGTIHGLGLLAATAMALTGSILFVELYPNQPIFSATHFILHLHSFIA
ncbi:MAG: cytochrome b/b6 domain-containing protein, partial [Pseudomonadota bacterium]|nr:cytochrome b/b6 domain-containing protein [Pseudomonadota bacterium]